MADPESKQHESITLNAPRVLWAAGATVMILAAALAASGLVMVWLARELPPETTASPQASWQRGSSRAEVEPNQAVAMGALRRRHQQLLSEYRWVERQQNVARIPIERAIELLAEQELAVPWSESEAEGESEARGGSEADSEEATQ